MTDTAPIKAAFVGYQGFGNLGDEAILAGIERVLEQVGITGALLIGGPEVQDAPSAPTAHRLQPFRLLPTPSALRALGQCDVLVLSGGGLFNDHWFTVIPRYLAWIIGARLLGLKVVWLGIGVGPIRRAPFRWLSRIAAGLSHAVIVRDRASAKVLGRGHRVQIAPDMAFFNERPRMGVRAPVLGLIVRPPVGSDPQETTVLRRLLCRIATEAAARGLEPRIECMAPAVDREFADRLADEIAMAIDRRPIVEELGRTPAEALERIVGWHAVASVRLHGLILSALAGVPCLPIAYDPKVCAIAEQLGLHDVVVPLDGGGADVGTVLDDALRPERNARVGRVVDAMRRTDMKVGRAVLDVVRHRSNVEA